MPKESKRFLEGYYEVRVVKKLNKRTRRYLVGWEGYASDDDTWEPRSSICHTQPFKEFEEIQNGEAAPTKKSPEKEMEVESESEEELESDKEEMDSSGSSSSSVDSSASEEWKDDERAHLHEQEQEAKDLVEVEKSEDFEGMTYECSHCRAMVSQQLLESITSKGAMICLDCFVREATPLLSGSKLLNKSLPPVAKEQAQFTSREAAEAEQMFLSAIKGNGEFTQAEIPAPPESSSEIIEKSEKGTANSEDEIATASEVISKFPTLTEEPPVLQLKQFSIPQKKKETSENTPASIPPEMKSDNGPKSPSSITTASEVISQFPTLSEEPPVLDLKQLSSPPKKKKTSENTSVPIPPEISKKLEKTDFSSAMQLSPEKFRRLLNSKEAQQELKSLVLRVRPANKESREAYINRMGNELLRLPNVRIRKDILDRNWVREICGKAFNASQSESSEESLVSSGTLAISKSTAASKTDVNERCDYCAFTSSTGILTESSTIAGKRLCNSCAWFERTFHKLMPRSSRPQTLSMGKKSMKNRGRWCDYCFRPSSSSTPRLSKCKTIPGIMICRACYNHEKDHGTLVRAEHAKRLPQGVRKAKKTHQQKEVSNCVFCGKSESEIGPNSICAKCQHKAQNSPVPPLQKIPAGEPHGKQTFPSNRVCDMCFKTSQEKSNSQQAIFYASKRFKSWFLCRSCISKAENPAARKSDAGYATISFSERPFGFTCNNGKNGRNAILQCKIPELKQITIGSVVHKVNETVVYGKDFQSIRQLLNRIPLPCKVTFLLATPTGTTPTKDLQPVSDIAPRSEVGEKRKLEVTPDKQVKRPKPNPVKSEAKISSPPPEIATKANISSPPVKSEVFQPPSVDEFLTRLAVRRKNKKFKEAGEILKKEGMDFLSIKFCSFDDVKDFGIPRWMWSNIIAEAKILEGSFSCIT